MENKSIWKVINANGCEYFFDDLSHVGNSINAAYENWRVKPEIVENSPTEVVWFAADNKRIVATRVDVYSRTIKF